MQEFYVMQSHFMCLGPWSGCVIKLPAAVSRQAWLIHSHQQHFQRKKKNTFKGRHTIFYFVPNIYYPQISFLQNKSITN